MKRMYMGVSPRKSAQCLFMKIFKAGEIIQGRAERDKLRE
jgi:hypothetical protein